MQIGETLKSIESKTDIQEFSADESIWSQIVEIVKFSGPAVGLWLCGPLMSLIDTAVIGQGSSIELAALGNAHRAQLLGSLFYMVQEWYCHFGPIQCSYQIARQMLPEKFQVTN